MPINLNQLNPQALAALASQRVGNLNLPVASVQPGLFQQGLFQGRQARDQQRLAYDQLVTQQVIEQLKQQGLNQRQAEELVAQAQLEQYKQGQQNLRTGVTEQGAMQRAMMQNQLGYEQLASQDAYRQGTLGLKQAELQDTSQYRQGILENKNQQVMLEQYKIDLQERMKMGEQKLQQRAGISAAVAKLLSKEKDPYKQDMIIKQYNDLLDKLGLADKSYSATLAGAPKEMRVALIEGDVAMNKAATMFYKDATKRSDLQQKIADANAALEAAGKPKLTALQEADIYVQNAFNAPKKGLATLDTKIRDMQLDAKLKPIMEVNKNSDKLLQDIQNFRIANSKFDTGIFSPMKLSLQQAYQQATGNPIESTAYGESIKKLGMGFVMQHIQQTKGAVSDREMSTFEKASPNLRNSQLGNEYILNMMESSIIRSIELEKFMTDFVSKNNTLSGYEEAWNRYAQENLAINPVTFAIMKPGEQWTHQGKEYKYLGGDPNKSSSWQEIK